MATRGRFVELKRSLAESRINNYNDKILTLWSANMDIQPVGSMFGVVYYVAKYISKEESTTFRPDIQEALQALKEADSINFLQSLLKATNNLMAKRERSGQEVACLCCGLPLKGSNHTCVFVNTHDSGNRVRVLKKDCLKDEHEPLQDRDFASDIHDKYHRRPVELEELCLAEFAQWWKFDFSNNNIKRAEELEDDSSISEEEGDLPIATLRLQNSRTALIRRRKPAVVKSPYISHIEDPEAYYYSLLLLYFPFRNEAEILNGYNSAFECYEARFHLLRPNAINGKNSDI